MIADCEHAQAEPAGAERRPRRMRPRVLVLVPLLGAFLGSLVSALVIRPQPPCAEPAICVVDVRRGGGCLPGPYDVPRGLPIELWVGIASVLLLGLLVAVVFELRRHWVVRPAG